MMRSHFFSALMPHPPVIVPAVGGRRLEDCRGTVDACRQVARRLVDAAPERLILISPHSPRRVDAFGIWSGELLYGDLSSFGAPGAAVELPNDRAMADLITASAREHGEATWRIPRHDLDHGAVVPLWFLVEAGWHGPTTILSLVAPEAGLSDHSEDQRCQQLGRAIAEAMRVAGSPSVAIVASGDMSHRLTPDAPAGFDPRAIDHDLAFVACVGEGRLADLAALDSDLRRHAAEDAVASSLVAIAASDSAPLAPSVVSYEHPFGVGYLVATFTADVTDS